MFFFIYLCCKPAFIGFLDNKIIGDTFECLDYYKSIQTKYKKQRKTETKREIIIIIMWSWRKKWNSEKRVDIKERNRWKKTYYLYISFHYTVLHSRNETASQQAILHHIPHIHGATTTTAPTITKKKEK